MAVDLLTFPGLEAVPVQPELSPVVRHHRDNDFLGFGEDAGASVAIRLPVAATLMEIRWMAVRKPTIFEPKLNQPPDEDRFHVRSPDCIIGARDWGVHYVNRGLNKSGRPIDTIGVQPVISQAFSEEVPLLTYNVPVQGLTAKHTPAREVRSMHVGLVALLSGLVLIASPAAGQTPARTPAAGPSEKPGFAHAHEKWTGDLDGMIKRRTIRVLVPYSKTYYFVDRAVQRGISYDVTRVLEADVNKKLKTGKIRLSVLCIPVNRGEMIPGLLDGRGDIAMGNLTITPERLKQVDFTEPFMRNAVEIAVTGPGAEPITTAEDLSGKEVYLRKSSSYYQSIESLNAELTRTGKAPVKVRLAPENLEAEDILEMVSAGLVKITIVEDYLAAFWAQIFPKLTPHPGVIVRTAGDIAWMVRKDNPKLKAELNDFLAHVAKSGQRTELLAKYLRNTRWAKGVTSKDEVRKFEQTVALFRKYGDRYDVEYLLLMAQAYQESELNQTARSPVGAIGVMQVMPATGKDMRVGDINQLEPNIHAGVKFLRSMMDEYYANEPMDRFNKTLFTFAAYNAGPGRVGQLRSIAARRGLDPNVWFNNVELIAAEKIGRETVAYVSNIYKYYLAYQMIEDERAARQKTKEEIKSTGR